MKLLSRCLGRRIATTTSKKRKGRVRQHVNPLADKFQAPIGAFMSNWSEIPFEDGRKDRTLRSFSTGPYQHTHTHTSTVILDLGCAKAKYLRHLASLNVNMNYLGIEIREEVAEYANLKAKEEGLGNFHVIGGFAAESVLPDVTRCVQDADVKLRALNVFHPDPWVKKKHIKRRIVNSSFVRLLETYLPRDTAILLQTDVSDLHEYHREVFQENSKRYLFTDDEEHVAPCFETYMGDVLTDRHRAVLNNDGDIYRAVLLERD